MRPFALVGLIALLAPSWLAGCERTPPSFMARSQQDCDRGDQDACGMIGAFASPRPRKAAPSASQTQMNVQAILRGMDRARASRQPGYREDLPVAVPETDDEDADSQERPEAKDMP